MYNDEYSRYTNFYGQAAAKKAKVKARKAPSVRLKKYYDVMSNYDFRQALSDRFSEEQAKALSDMVVHFFNGTTSAEEKEALVYHSDFVTCIRNETYREALTAINNLAPDESVLGVMDTVFGGFSNPAIERLKEKAKSLGLS